MTIPIRYIRALCCGILFYAYPAASLPARADASLPSSAVRLERAENGTAAGNPAREAESSRTGDRKKRKQPRKPAGSPVVDSAACLSGQTVRYLPENRELIANGKKITENVRKDKQYYLLRGIDAYNRRQVNPAKADFLQVLALEPENDAAYYYLANLSLLEGDIVTCETLLKKAVELDSANYWYSDLLAQLYLRTGQPQKAIPLYESLLARYPRKAAVYYNLADLYMNQKDIEKTTLILDKIEQITGKSEAVGLAKFNLYRMQSDWDGALKYLIEFDKEVPSARIETMIADMYSDRFKDTLALQYYAKALRNEPLYAPAMFGEAEVYRMQQDYDSYFEKINPFLKSPYIDPAMKEEYLKQVFMTPQFIQRFRPQVDTMIQNLLETHPQDSTTLSLAAAYYNEFGDKNRSRELLKYNYQTLHPDKISAAFQYLSYLYYLEDWENLEKESGEALKNFPDNTDFLQMIGISQYQTQRTEEAARTYRRLEEAALRKNDTLNLLTAYATMGDLYYQISTPSKAYSYYKKALEIDPDYAPVLNNYAYYLSESKKSLKKAYEMSKKTVEAEPDNPTYLDTYGWILFQMGMAEEAKPYFKHAMLYGGKEDADILDHYAEVLYALKEYDLAFIYWEQADALDKTLGIAEKIKLRKEQQKQ